MRDARIRPSPVVRERPDRPGGGCRRSRRPAACVAGTGDRVRRGRVPGESGHHPVTRIDLSCRKARRRAGRRRQRQRRQPQLRPRGRQQRFEVHDRPRPRHRRLRRVRPDHGVHRLREPGRRGGSHPPQRRGEGNGWAGISTCSTPTSPPRSTPATRPSICGSATTSSTGARARSFQAGSAPSTPST